MDRNAPEAFSAITEGHSMSYKPGEGAKVEYSTLSDTLLLQSIGGCQPSIRKRLDTGLASISEVEPYIEDDGSSTTSEVVTETSQTLLLRDVVGQMSFARVPGDSVDTHAGTHPPMATPILENELREEAATSNDMGDCARRSSERVEAGSFWDLISETFSGMCCTSSSGKANPPADFPPPSSQRRYRRSQKPASSANQV